MSDNEDRSDKNERHAESSSEKPEIQRALATIFEEVGIDLPAQSLEILSANMSFQGPLPPPNMLRNYGQIVPGLDIRIIEAWEREQTHNENIQKSLLKSSNIRSRTGQWMAFAIALIGLGAAFIALQGGHQWAASVIGSAALASPIVSLFRSRQNR